ncbi:MAG TPA: PilZ domain-containing protein [Pyrinomonadaceae bacterium]|nr:PilZ domain-containing protein [Pyrinomonadaceae bacterium]
MPELLRSMVARMRVYIGNRRRARRHRLSVSFNVSIFDPKLSREQLEHAPYLEGATSDLSASGLGLVVPAIRINDRYLTAPGQTLHLILELSDGRAELRVAPVRYEQLEREGAAVGYLIGVRIEEMSDADRARFEDYLSRQA